MQGEYKNTKLLTPTDYIMYIVKVRNIIFIQIW